MTASEAQSITSGGIERIDEAPLGPTCIYKLSKASAPITLSVEPVTFSQATHQLTHRQRVSVEGHQAYCGKAGTQMLLVRLADRRLLNVTAPCSVAQHFAAIAVSHLAA